MKKLPACLGILLIAGGLGLTLIAPAAETSPEAPVLWGEDYAQALVVAKKEHKLVLLDFTGSDWCIWCQRLHEEVFSQRAFARYAREHLVLVELDYPRGKTQPRELRKQNKELSDRFSVTGYPTVVLVDTTGKELGRSGYMEGGAKTFVRELKRLAEKAMPGSSGE